MPGLGDFGPRVWLLIGGIILAALLIGLLFLLIGSIMEFVLIESLRQEEVSVRQYWSELWRQGVRLFAFRVLIGLIVFGSVALIAALFLLPVIVESGPGIANPFSGFSVVAFLLLLPVIIVLAVLVGLVNGFTTVFVVPIMVLDECGVLDGWRRLWPTITANPWQYLTYAVASFVLSIAGGIAIAIVAGLSVLLLLIPFGILGLIGFGLFLAVAPVGIAVLAIVGILFVLAVLAVIALVQMPVVTYLRYYALLVLGDISDDLDLIPDRRSAIRGGDDATE